LRQLSSNPAFQDQVNHLEAAVSELGQGGTFREALGRVKQNHPQSSLKLDVSPGQAVDSTGSKDFDSILIVVLKHQLPKHLGSFGALFASLIIVAIMAASMSTADSNLHALSAVLTRDIYDQFVRPQASERERVWVGRTVILAATTLSLVIVIVGRQSGTLSKHNFLNMIAQMGFTAIDFSTQLLPVAVDMLFLRKGTGKGAAAGLAAGLLAAFVFGPLFAMLVSALGEPAALTSIVEQVKAINGDVPMHKSVWGLMLNIPIFVLVSLFTRKPDPNKIEQYRQIFAGR
jgi:Na+/proline symporter